MISPSGRNNYPVGQHRAVNQPWPARQGHVANAPADVRRGSYPGRRRNIMKDELTAWPDIARWRKAERERLIAARLAIPADARAAMSTTIAAQLDAIVG